VEQLCGAIDEAKAAKGKASIIIANTIKGKGVSFMEGLAAWHGQTPNNEQFVKAFEELNAARKALEV
jgi:transketolase